MNPTPTAFSYVRFSTPEQAKGDSLRRQTDATKVWCERNGVALDESTTLHDLGRSAYTGKHRDNPDRHALAGFLKLVEKGKVPRGSYLVVENLDRLSREHIQPALLLVLNLLQAGVRIVQLKPAEMVFDDKSDTMPVMMMMMELSRGHGESALKSERVGATWEKKREAARQGKAQPPRRLDGRVTTAITGRLPAWVEDRGGEMCLVPERAAAVRRIFQLAAAGYGYTRMIRRLQEEGIPAFGERVVKPGRKRSAFSGEWSVSYLADLIADRRAVGEYQPRTRGRKPDGDPIPNYFPAAVTEEEWLLARAAIGSRTSAKTRTGKYVNIFAGLLTHARDGTGMLAVTKVKPLRRMLANYRGVTGKATNYSFPFPVFEDSILKKLREIDPQKILNGDEGPDESLALGAQFARVEADIASISRELDEHGESPTLYRRLRAKEDELRDLADRLAEAQQRATYPLSAAWGECQTLAEALDQAADKDDVRLRLRAALRRIVEGVWVLIVPRGKVRLAAVQMWFAPAHKGGPAVKQRSFLIYHRDGNANANTTRPAHSDVLSFADVAAPGSLDLRKRADVAKVERFLLEFNIGDG